MTIRLDSVQAERTAQRVSSEELFFDINAKLEEQKKGSDQAVLSFELTITTKPNVVKYTVMGTVTLEGSTLDIKKRLEVNPKTKIPQILFTVYQHVFSSIYILSSILNTPYPPPDLLHPMQEKIQILPATSKNEDMQAAKVQETPAEKPPAQTTTAPPA
ncbi:MAG: hypothetical protein WCD81_05005 [Candidatus Bathyarchaeia archaeon]